MKTPRGFTLIETIIYIALFGILIGGAIETSYLLLQGANSTQVKTTVQDEGTFAMEKFNWTLTGTSSQAKIISPTLGNIGSTLSLVRGDGTQVDVRLNSGAIEMREGGVGAYTAITTSNVKVTKLSFYHFAGPDGGEGGVQASTTISGTTFTMEKYFRK